MTLYYSLNAANLGNVIRDWLEEPVDVWSLPIRCVILDILYKKFVYERLSDAMSSDCKNME